MTLKQVFDQTAKQDYGRFERATQVRVTGLKAGTSRATGRVTFLAKTQTPEKRGPRVVWEKYVTSISFFPNKKHVILSCSCPDFVFSGAEYLLSMKGAAEIVYGNGEPPETGKRIFCCKHIVMVTSNLVDRGYLNNVFERV